MAPVTFEGGTDGEAFKAYIQQVLVPQLWLGACVVMDNFSSHKVAGVKEAIKAAGARLVYLSPYSPDFNPIENCWSKLKTFLRSKAARTHEALQKAIKGAIETIAVANILMTHQASTYEL